MEIAELFPLTPTRTPWGCRLWREVDPDRNSGTAQWTRSIFVEQALGLLVSVSSTHYCASTSDLSPSDLLGALPGYPVGAIILERASRLDAFSGYHFRT